MKKIALGALLILTLLIVAGRSAPTSANHADASQGVTYSVRLEADSILGGPTVSAAFIESVLDAAHSPAAGTGQALFDVGVEYGIDPAYALAFFHHESSYGTTGEARVTRSLGNERCLADRPCIDRDRGGYALMNSWEDGYQHWYSLMLSGYVQGHINQDVGRDACPCTTVAQIIPVYAPSSDGNDEAAYIRAVETDVANWRGQQPRS